jgi:hypothetical protein
MIPMKYTTLVPAVLITADILLGLIAICTIIDTHFCVESRTVVFKRRNAWGEWVEAERVEVEVMPEHQKRASIDAYVGSTCTVLFLLIFAWLMYAY